MNFLDKNVHHSYTLLIFEEQNAGTLWPGLIEQKKKIFNNKKII